jgi:hypothetical protein
VQRKDLSKRLYDFNQFIENRESYLEGKPEDFQLQMRKFAPRYCSSRAKTKGAKQL